MAGHEQGSSGRGTRSAAAGEQPLTFSQLKAVRDAHDRAAKSRKEKEDEAFRRYSAAAKAAAKIAPKLAKDLAALDKRAQELRENAAERQAQAEAEVGDALADLKGSGRSVEQVAEWVRLPVKRVRKLIADAQKRAAADEPAAAPPVISESAASASEGQSDAAEVVESAAAESGTDSQSVAVSN